MHIPCIPDAYSPHAIRCNLELPATTSSVHTARVRKSSLRLVSTPSAAAHAQLTQPADGTHRAKTLVKLQRTAPSSCSHHLRAHLRSARIVLCGENVKVSGGDREGSSSQGCLPEVILRCVAAGRRSLPDISLTLSVCRVDLRRFTGRVTRAHVPAVLRSLYAFRTGP